MTLTLSLGVNGGGAAAKKRKVMDGVGDVAAAGGGDRATVMRLLQARDRMVKVELDHEDGDKAVTGVRVGGGFRVTEAGDGKAMALGWRDRALITATAWRPCRRSVGKNEP
ncbi:hypothetical protein TRIUR3_26012 [Triticum urartu]|uniref:Uncharacterized protein n=1 Tax=Triticum urartu TaxID=4572 RepID=M7YZN1_TRIUA|nr:hypothetical protein TRIUR3_26012 [Triticum urartu]